MWSRIFVMSNHMEIYHICLNFFFLTCCKMASWSSNLTFFFLPSPNGIIYCIILVNRFDGTKFLEKSTGKKIMFVGDSISNNMWQSLTCLLHIAVPNSNYTFTSQIQELSVFSIPVVILFSLHFHFKKVLNLCSLLLA